MKYLLIALLIPAFSFAQITGRKSKDAIIIYDSISVAPGDTLYLGNGSDRRGDFMYIYQPTNFILGVQETSLPRGYANKHFVIKHFKKQKDKRTGEKTVAVVSFGGFNYVADIESAIKAQEVTSINGRSFIKKEEPKSIVVKNEISVADELAKLKRLMDDGIISKDEFDAQKKKLLEKN